LLTPYKPIRIISIFLFYLLKTVVFKAAAKVDSFLITASLFLINFNKNQLPPDYQVDIFYQTKTTAYSTHIQVIYICNDNLA